MLCAQMKKTGGVFIVLGASLLQVQSGGVPSLVHRFGERHLLQGKRQVAAGPVRRKYRGWKTGWAEKTLDERYVVKSSLPGV